jgi:hypothetical protein
LGRWLGSGSLRRRLRLLSHIKCLRNARFTTIKKKNRTFFSAGASSSSAVPFASSSALRFFPRGALDFSSLSADSLSAFFALGFAAFLGAVSSFGCSLMREERRGSVLDSPDAAVVPAALRGIVEGRRGFKAKQWKWGSEEETRFGHPNRFNISLLILPKQFLITCNVLGHAIVPVRFKS